MMLVKEIEVKKWGNSQGLRLSKDDLREFGATDSVGMHLKMMIEAGRITLTSVSKHPTSLEELFAGYTGEPLSEKDKYDWGEPVGRELL